MAQFASVVLWALSLTASCGRYRKGEKAQRSKFLQTNVQHRNFGHRKRADKAKLTIPIDCKIQHNTFIGAWRSLVARLLWALSLTASCGRYRKGEKAQRSKFLQTNVQHRNFGYRKRANKANPDVLIQSSTKYSFRGVAQFGSALALGARCRRFKSCRPDHMGA